MPTTTARTYTIVNGPTVDRIWDAAKYACDKLGAKIPVQFWTSSRLAGPIETSAQVVLTPDINGVQHEDGSGDSVNFTGYINNRPFRGYYKGRTRSGHIVVE